MTGVKKSKDLGREILNSLLEARTEDTDPVLTDILEEIEALVEAPIGTKADYGKARFDRIEWSIVEEVANVLAYGAAQHSENEDGWKSLPNGRSRYFAAAMRHLVAWWGGEERDQESGLPHLAHVICNVMFLRARDRDGL